MIQIAAKNWQAHGHILGTNEILGIMLHRDLMVLGLSDGVLFAATGFGWILQKLILRGYLSWDSTGWIIQSVLWRAPRAFLQMLTGGLLGLADVLCPCFLVLDIVSRMALDPCSLFRTPWPSDANEAA
jgi:hypothetical protein